MNPEFEILYLAIMAGVAIAGTCAMCWSPQRTHRRALLEALVWGGSLAISATVDFLVIAPGANYLIAVA